MFPILFQIGPVTIHTYGFLIAIGFIVALEVIKRLALHAKLNVDLVVDLTFRSLLIGFIGARTLYIITRFEDFASNPLDIFKVWEGGLVFYGGPLAVIPYILWQATKRRMQLWTLMDVMTPGLVIAHAFGRFGCLAAGCCYGKPTGSDWGFKFSSDMVDVALRGVPLHPTQLYESSALIILFLGLIWISFHKKIQGQVVLTYLLTYPLIRSVVEIFRGDTIRGFIIDDVLSTSQFISILVFLAALFTLLARLRVQPKQTKKS